MAPNQSTMQRQPCKHINDLPLEILCMILKSSTRSYGNYSISSFEPTCFCVWRVCKLWSDIYFNVLWSYNLNTEFKWSENVKTMKGLERVWVGDTARETKIDHPLLQLCGAFCAVGSTPFNGWETLFVVLRHKIAEDVEKQMQEWVKLWRE